MNQSISVEVYKTKEQAHLEKWQDAREINYARSNMQRCPVCGVYESYITNVHCMKEHGVSKREIEEKYGKIINEGRRLSNEKAR